jgi:hypothetical protein
MNSTWQALSREAGTAAEHLAIGVTAIGKANYAQDAYYTQAFFALSIGLERTAKLILVIDHALKHNGQFPKNVEVRSYKHNLQELLNQLDKIAEQRGLMKPKHQLPRSSIHDGILEVLSEFANNITRYYNFDLITGHSNSKNIQDPIKAWFEKVTIPVLAVHYKVHHQSKIEANAKAVAELLGEYTYVFHHSEDGEKLDSIYDASIHTGMTNFAKPYIRMYVMQIARFLAILITDFTFAAHEAQLPDIPYLSEFFVIFNNSDNYFKKRQTWSIYRM